MTSPPPPHRRLTRRERRRQAEERGPLRPRRAYRAAFEALDEGLHLWKIADQKSRVAIQVLGPFAVLVLVLLANVHALEAVSPRVRLLIVTALSLTAGLGMLLFFIAIGTLRPEEPEPAPRDPSDPDAPLGLRHYPSILTWDLDAYREAWKQVAPRQLIAEMAVQTHFVSKANRRKYAALDRLFRGLLGMMILVVALTGISLAAIALEGRAERIKLRHGIRLTIPVLPTASPAQASPAPGASPGFDYVSP
jgi:hypothetical protein